ncbi:uncharacterized protein LOC107429501 isoform X1 [Ziziphus jujuba]|uniref:Uncharacterized protein LOC107429501 isoform X1 n=1 Tax=Ziziphus jujuba TaxID=326968 RepID=A0A6P4AIS2_ZIZJJ|nr:uncharacterized protein LOC107429501 isoform X1 [Ziziphus jujuba]
MLLHYQDPAKLKTRKIVFEDTYAASDSFTLEQLKELSSKRRLIEDSINESSSITDAIAREMAGGLTSHTEQVLYKLEQYLPLLENFIFHVDKVSGNFQIAQWASDLKIRWTSALISSSGLKLRGPKFFQMDNLRFELSMTTFLYGAILRQRALELLPVDLVESTTLFRQAAGVYHYLAHEVLPSLQPSLAVEKPPEVVSSLSFVLRLICLADAQAVTIRKAEEKGTTSGLLAKLHHGVAELLDEAAAVLDTTKIECKNICSQIVEFVSCCRALHELRSRKFVAENLKTASQMGFSIGVLRQALIDVRRKLPSKESWKSIFKKEMDEVAEFLRKLEHENTFIWNERVPSSDELPIPEGNKIVNIIPYHPKRWEREIFFKL